MSYEDLPFRATKDIDMVLIVETLKKGIELIDGISILKAEHIIPFKAKARIELTQRKESGEHVDSHDIKKHKNDIFRLSVLLTPEQKIELPDSIKRDMSLFISMMLEELNLKQLGISNMTKNNILKLFIQIYEIPQLQYI